MTGPDVSVVVPVHNRAHLVSRALDSAVRQDVAAFEIIVVDDGSTDDLSEMLTRHPPYGLRLIRHSIRRGAAAARNTGIAAARAPYIAFLDSDDEWLPGKLRQQLEALAADPSDTAMCLTACILDRGPGIRQIMAPPMDRPCRDVVVSGHALNLGTSALVPRAVFAEIGGFDEGLERLEDWEWMLRFSRRWSYVAVARPLAVVHVEDRLVAPEVERAVARIVAQHGPTLAAEGRSRRFRSTLLVERAFRCILHGGRSKAALLILAALILDPPRFFNLLARACRRFGPAKSTPAGHVAIGKSYRVPSPKSRFGH